MINFYLLSLNNKNNVNKLCNNELKATAVLKYTHKQQ